MPLFVALALDPGLLTLQLLGETALGGRAFQPHLTVGRVRRGPARYERLRTWVLQGSR